MDLWIHGNATITKSDKSGKTLIDFGFKTLVADEIQKRQSPALQRDTVALNVMIPFGAKTAEESAAQSESPAKVLSAPSPAAPLAARAPTIP